MVDGNDSPELKFLTSLYQQAETRHGISRSTIISIAKQADYSLPINLVLKEKTQALERLRPEVDFLDLPAEGAWKTTDQLLELGVGHSRSELITYLDERKGLFPPRITGEEKAYWIGSQHILKLPKPGSNVIWPAKYQQFSRLYGEVQELQQELDRIREKRRSLEERVGGEAPRIKSEPVPNNVSEGMYLTIAQVVAAGSKYNVADLHNLVLRNPARFKARKIEKDGRDAYWEVILNDDTVGSLGLAPVIEDAVKPSRRQAASPTQEPLRPATGGGIRMSVQDIIANGSMYQRGSLSQIISKNVGLLYAERMPGRGSPWSVLVNEGNFTVLGLDKLPGSADKVSKDPETRNLPQDILATKAPALEERVTSDRGKVKLTIAKEEIEFDPAKNYSLDDVARILNKIHPDVFNRNRLPRIWEFLGVNGGNAVGGGKLIPYLSEVNGMLVLTTTSTQRKLGELLGGDFGQVAPLIEQYHLQRFIHNHPTCDAPFMRTQELPALQVAISQARGVPIKPSERLERIVASVPARSLSTAGSTIQTGPASPSPSTSLRIYHGRFQAEGIMPNNFCYNLLTDSGALRRETAEEVERTYSKYESAMQGWRFVDLRKIGDRLGISPGNFLVKFIEVLKAQKLAKDLVVELGGRSGSKSLYVFAEGKGKQIGGVIKSAMNIDVSECFN